MISPLVFDDAPRPVAVLGHWAATGTAIATTLVVALGLGAQPLLDAARHTRLLP